ncbi:hypothetical protein [Halocatena pleomorpha]|uniref:hypothetical protein n=1 Tax=Halocatena pleomorpha TaxID=1785090 RepID=UPI001F37D62F|nr:hypothetical protein [Halocatena pleomorpha]
MGDLTAGVTREYLPALFGTCEDAGTIVAITDGWVEEVRPDGTRKLIADISVAVAEEERRRLIKRLRLARRELRIRASGLVLSAGLRAG